MKWKVVAGGEEPSLKTISLIAEITSLLHDDVLSQLADGNLVIRSGLPENDAQKLADQLGRDRGVSCRVLPDSSSIPDELPRFSIVLVDFRPGYRTRLRRKLQKLTGLPHEQIVHWLSRIPFSLGSGVDGETAKSIRKTIVEAGGIVRVEAESATEERASRKFRTTAVFHSPTGGFSGKSHRRHGSDTDQVNGKDEGKKRKNEQSGRKKTPAPPVIELPDGITAGLPPVDGIDGSLGRMMGAPPSRFLPGEPSPVLKDGFLESSPPVIQERKVKKPHKVIFDYPPSILEVIPEIVGGTWDSSLARGPLPDVVYHFHPETCEKRLNLLPPLIGSGEFPGGEGSIPPVCTDPRNHRLRRGLRSSVRRTGADKIMGSRDFSFSSTPVVKLYVCTPPAERTDDVAAAISEVLGFSPDKSRKLLEQSPSCLAKYWSDEKAREVAHRLEQRGVSVTITNGQVSSNGQNYSNFSNGFQAWLMANG